VTTIREYWLSYAKAVVPVDASVVQRIECRRAFYAGAMACFGHITNDVADLSDDDGCVAMSKLLAELLRFKDAIGTAAEGEA
jgi:hypothetical protein